MDRRLHLRITGLVQGVFFRASTRDTAADLGLSGWVRNCPDGSVEVLAEGPSERLEKLQRWCYGGPPAAHVEDVQVRWLEATGEFNGFSVRY